MKKLYGILLLLITLISGSAYAAEITDDFTVNVNFDDTNNIVSVNGEIELIKNKSVSARVVYNGEAESNQDGTTVGFTQAIVGDDGSFLIEIPIGQNAKSGWYTIYLGGQFSVIGENSPFVHKMYFMNETAFYSAVEAINNAADKDAIADIFNANTYLGYSSDEKTTEIFYNLKVEKGGFDLTETVEALKSDLDETMELAKIIKTINFDADKEESLQEAAKIFGYDETKVADNKAEMARILNERKATAGNKAQLKTLMDETFTVAQINNSTYDGLSDILIHNKDILGINTDIYVTMDKIAVNKKLVRRNFNSAVVFKAAFDAAISEVQNGSGSGSSGNTGGGSTGGGGGRKVSQGTSVAITPQIPTGTPATTPETNNPFGDLDKAAWAKDSIINLYNKKIISGKSEKEFCPNDYITREEFVTIAVKAFNKYNPDAALNFTDADGNMWYAPYIASAQEAGIISGNSDGSFGIGALIKREDMAVILYRIAKSNISLESSDTKFNDYDNISDYAKEAVTACSSAGIISGMGDNNFAPKANATRAQAARMIEMLMKEVEK